MRVINTWEVIIRGKPEKQITMLSALTPDQLVPQDHPIRQIKPIVDQALKELSPTFNRMYAELGTSIDTSRAHAQGEPFDGALLHPQ